MRKDWGGGEGGWYGRWAWGASKTIVTNDTAMDISEMYREPDFEYGQKPTTKPSGSLLQAWQASPTDGRPTPWFSLISLSVVVRMSPRSRRMAPICR